MGKCAHIERVGQKLQLVETEPSIISSMEITGDFPIGKHVSVVFDYAGERDEMIVHLTRKVGRQETACKFWNLKAVEDRDAKKLGGFLDFALSLGITGAQLAHLISGLRPRQ